MSLRALRPIARAALHARPALPAQRVVPAFRPAVAALARNFTTSPRRLGSGETDSALSGVIAAEQKYELETAATLPELPEFIDAFRSNGVWDIVDAPMNDDVVLVRKFGNEKIKLTFQVSDLDVPSDAEIPIEGEVAAEDTDASPYITCSLVITKHAHPDAMSVDLEAGEDGFEVTNVAMFESAVAEAEGAEGDWQRRSKYMGPQYEHLDAGVQEAFGAFLAERGVDDGLAQFIISYCEYKEQKDYVSWLEAVKGFVEH
ncbi:hypothetical protein JCM24511_01681 [Saitozyma sp. JCM 24511]|nr:hypothetical protein JCM24511_01681 [Saitozyma sp. JCM 24511]